MPNDVVVSAYTVAARVFVELVGTDVYFHDIFLRAFFDLYALVAVGADDVAFDHVAEAVVRSFIDPLHIIRSNTAAA